MLLQSSVKKYHEVIISLILARIILNYSDTFCIIKKFIGVRDIHTGINFISGGSREEFVEVEGNRLENIRVCFNILRS